MKLLTKREPFLPGMIVVKSWTNSDNIESSLAEKVAGPTSSKVIQPTGIDMKIKQW